MCVGLTEWAPARQYSLSSSPRADERDKAGLCCECTETLRIVLQGPTSMHSSVLQRVHKAFTPQLLILCCGSQVENLKAIF